MVVALLANLKVLLEFQSVNHRLALGALIDPLPNAVQSAAANGRRRIVERLRRGFSRVSRRSGRAWRRGACDTKSVKT